MTMSLTNEQHPYDKANELPTIINNGNGHHTATLNCLPWKPDMNPIQDIEDGIGQEFQINTMEAFTVPPTYRCVRNPLHTRHTVIEWNSANHTNLYLLDSLLEKEQPIPTENSRTCRDADDRTNWNQSESTLHLRKRISEVIFWRNRIFVEADKMLNETTALNSCKALLDELDVLFDETLRIDQECLYLRDKREKMDFVHDSGERSLVSEVDLFLKWKAIIKIELEKIANKLALNRSAQSILEKDISDKFTAEEIDETAYQKRNSSEGPSCYKNRGDTSVSDQKSWLDAALGTIKHSENEREASILLRRHIDSLVERLCHEILDKWEKTNQHLRECVKDTLDIRNRLQTRLSQLIAEMFQLNKSIESTKKCIDDKKRQLHVALCRLEIRHSRPNLESCRGPAQINLLNEVEEIRKTVADLQKKLCYSESILEEMKSMKTALEEEIASKNSSLYIDREKCLTLRKYFPLLKTISKRIFLSK